MPTRSTGRCVILYTSVTEVDLDVRHEIKVAFIIEFGVDDDQDDVDVVDVTADGYDSVTRRCVHTRYRPGRLAPHQRR